MIKMYIVKCRLFLSDFNGTWICKNTETSNMKIRSVEDELFHADRRTANNDEDIIRFSQFRECA